jgi:hypothetical protein
MAEGLRPEDHERAKQLYDQHRLAAKKVAQAQEDVDVIDHPPEGYADRVREQDREHLPAGGFRSKADDRLDEARSQYDTNTLMSEKHLKDHYERYVESARRDAADVGIEVNLDGPQSEVDTESPAT